MLAMNKKQQMVEKMKIYSTSPRVIALVNLTGNSIASLEELFDKKEFLLFTSNDTMEVLRSVQAADFVMFVVNAETDPTPYASLIKCIRAQGVGNVELVITGGERQEDKGFAEMARKVWMKFLNQEFATSHQKVYWIPTEFEALKRRLVSCKIKQVHWKESRPHVIITSVERLNEGEIRVSGWNRSAAFDPSDYVHVNGIGAVKISKLIVNGEQVDYMEQDCVMMDEKEELEEEQEMMQVECEEMQAESSVKMKRVPKGFSDYQSAWLDSEDDLSDYEDIPIATPEEEFDIEAYKQYKRLSEESLESDEKILDMDVPARKRFVKYRGLKNFRQCQWNLNEGLPEAYASIYKFQDFQKIRHEAISACSERPFSGAFISMHLPISSIGNAKALFGLFKNEEKKSVLHMTFQLSQGNEKIASKTKMKAILGFQEIFIQPIFSDNSPQTVHKYERVATGSTVYVASIYGPVLYGPCPVLFFHQNTDELLATGAVLDNNPNRLTLKRITLTGVPYKIHAKSAVIRFMFFSSADVLFFKPIQLITRSGVKGHIKESLGLKGSMKCVFEKPIQQQETICLHLYKRQFPKAE